MKHILLLLLLIGCGGSASGPAEPEEIVPVLGDYSYSMTWTHPLDCPGFACGVARTQAGTMAVLAASRGAITVRWNVTAYTDEPDTGSRLSDGYFVIAHFRGGTIVTHNLDPTAAGFRCSARVVGPGLAWSTAALDCTVVRL